jgi:hypothetical protein
VSYTEFNSNASPRRIYRHPTLSWDVIERYQQLFYRRFYFRPSFVLRRALRALRRGTLLSDLRNALRAGRFRLTSE